MGRMFNFCKTSISLLLCALFLLVHQTTGDVCQQGCPRTDSSKLKYLPGFDYQYNFRSVVTIGVERENTEQTELNIKSDVLLSYDGNCGYSLQLKNVEAQTTLENLKKELHPQINTPIKFTMVGTELEPQICVDENEDEYSLNIKRSIVSMLQSSNKKYETDIFGVCPTESYTSSEGDGLTVIKKLRNLNQCNYRENIIAYFASGIVDEKSKVKNRPFLNGEYVNEMKLLNGIYQSVNIIETYNSPSLSKGKPTVWVKVISSLTLVQKTASTAQKILNGKSKSIIFTHPSVKQIANFPVLKKVFDETVNLVSDYVKANSAHHFSELIRLMRNADENTLMELSKVRGDLAKKVYFDALIRTGTSVSIKVMAKLFNGWSIKEKRNALISLNLVRSIDFEALASVLNLVDYSLEPEAYLSVGNLIRTYCKTNSCKNDEMRDITKKFSKLLGQCNVQSKKDENKIIAILKGIKNTQNIDDSLPNQLIECAKPHHSNRIRVASLQSFLASPCHSQLQQFALNILKNQNEDSEIRIEAYLSVINCPSGEIANQLSDIIENENINQVGGFISSHLKSIRDSTDFTKEALKYHLGNIRVTKQFPIDITRYSFNRDISYQIESLGLGADVDYSVIYSQSGFLPRSFKFNMTNEVFGTAFNSFELNVRQENLERVLEHYFGPKGVFNKEPQEIFDHMNNLVSNQSIKSKRSIKDDVENFVSKTTHQEFSNDINLDMSLKLFGSELMFLSMGDYIPSNSDELTLTLQKAFVNFKNGLTKYEKKWEYHMLLQDFEFSYPTSSGLPLEFAIKSSTTGKFDFAVEIDVEQILENYKNSKYRLKLAPSQDINIETFLRVDAGVFASGLKTSSNLHSADGGDVALEFTNDGKGFKFNFLFPRQKVELMEFKHNTDFFLSTQDKESMVIPFKQNKRTTIFHPVCFDQLQSFGLTVCYTANFPLESNYGLPIFNGPVQMSIVLHTEKSIQLQGLYKNEKQFQSWKLMFDTPESISNHRAELQLKLGVTPKLFASVNLVTSERDFLGELGLLNDEKEIAFYGKIQANNMKTMQKLGFTKSGNVYRPLIYSKNGDEVSNELAGYKANGQFVVEHEEKDVIKYNIKDLKLISPEKKEIVFNGWVEIFSQLKGFNLEIDMKNFDKKQSKIYSHFKRENQNNISIAAFVEENDITDSKTGASFTLEYDNNNVHHQMEIRVGTNELKLFNKLNRELNGEDDKLHFQNSLELKSYRETLPLLFGKLNGKISQKNVEIDLHVTQSDKTISTALKIVRHEQAQGDLEINLNSKLNRHFVEFKAKIDSRDEKYFLNNQLITSFGLQSTLVGKMSQQYTSRNTFIDLNGSFKLNNNDKENTFSFKLNDTPEKFKSELKITRENAELVSFNADVAQTQEKQNGNCKLTIRDTFTGNAKFNVNKNGKGDLNGMIHFKKSGKPLKINAKFLYALPKFNIDTSIMIDDKKLIVKTENEFNKAKFNTKTNLEFGNEKIQLEVSAKEQDNLNNIEFSLLLPTKQTLTGKFKRETFNDFKSEIKMELFDMQPEGKTRSIEVNGFKHILDNTKNYFDANFKFIYKNFDEKDLILSLNAKHTPDEKINKILFGVNLLGSILTEPYKFTVNLSKITKENMQYEIETTIGKKLKSKIEGSYDSKILIDQNKENNLFTVKFSVDAPETQFKTISLFSSGSFKIQNKSDIKMLFVELDLNTKLQYSDKSSDFKMLLKGSPNSGTFDINLSCPKTGKNDIHASWEQKVRNQGNNYYGKLNHEIRFDIDTVGKIELISKIDKNEINDFNWNLLFKSSNKKVQNIEIKFKSKQIDSSEHSTFIEMQFNKDIYQADLKTYKNFPKYGIDYIVRTPTKNKKFYVIFENVSASYSKGDLNIQDLFGLDLISFLELKFNGVDDISFTWELNSEKLNIKNIKASIKARNKEIFLKINSDISLLLEGNAKYNIKNEESKIIIEGQGDLIYKNERKSTSFKLIKQIYNFEENKEIGFEYSFNGELGPKNFVSQLKATNKNFIAKLASCEESKQCTNFEIQSEWTLQNLDSTVIEHKSTVLIDFRELGYPYEFELQTKSLVNGLGIEYDIDTTLISNQNKKYKLLTTIKPENSLIEIIIPKRHMAIEVRNVLPKNSLFGKYEHSITYYLDKNNHPHDKGEFKISVSLDGVKQKKLLIGNFDILFGSPHLQKPISIFGQAKVDLFNKETGASISFDIFKLPEQKIVLEAHSGYFQNENELIFSADTKLSSSGLNLNSKATASAKFDFNQAKYEFLAEAIGTDNLKFSSKVSRDKGKLEILIVGFDKNLFSMKSTALIENMHLKSDIRILEFSSTPFIITLDTTPQQFKIVFKHENSWQLISEINVGKEAYILLTRGPNDTKVCHAKLSLSSGTLFATKYDVNKEEFNDFMKAIEEDFKKDLEDSNKKLKGYFDSTIQRSSVSLKEVKESLIDVNKLLSSYKNHLETLVKDLEQDENFAQLLKDLRMTMKNFLGLLEEFSVKSIELYKKVETLLLEFYEKQKNLLKQTIIPAFENLFKKLIEITNELHVELVHILQKTINHVQKVLENWENEFNALYKPFLEILKPFLDTLKQIYEITFSELSDILRNFNNFTEKLLSLMKNIIKRLNEHLRKIGYNKDELLSILHDVFDYLESFTANEEVKNLLAKLNFYINGKLLNPEKLDDFEELEKIYLSLIKVIKSLGLEFTNNSSASFLFGSLDNTIKPFTLVFDIFTKLTSLLTFKSSVLNYLKNESFYFSHEIFTNSLFVGFNYIKSYRLNGHIADGKHVFTFDGNYFTLSGTCKYVLAQDAIDNNFTVVANLVDGNMQSIILIDKLNYIEIDSSFNSKLNDKKVEYPIHKNKDGFHVWRDYYTVSILSSYGILIKCIKNLDVCHIQINGFYTSKIQGLLGNGNGELYDDFKTSNGEIQTNLNNFVTYYSLKKCAPIQSSPFKNRHQICSEIFDINSSLLPGYWFLNRIPFRDACNTAVELNPQNSENVACNIAAVYSSAAKLYYLPVSLPERCIKCSYNSNYLQYNDEFKISVPQNKADLVMVVDASLNIDELKELVQPVFNNVKQQLKNRGFNDIQVSVISFNRDQKYPNLLTHNGNFIFNGKIFDQELKGPKMEIVDLGSKWLNQLNEKLGLVTGPISSEVRVVDLLFNFPFRADAAKSIFIVQNNNIEASTDLLDSSILNYMFKRKGVSLNYLGNVQDLTYDGKEKDLEKIVGFNKRAISFLQGLSKRQKLDYKQNILIDTLVEEDSWIFILNNFKKLKSPELKKAFTMQVSTALADQLFKTEVQSDCKCSLKAGLYSEIECTKLSYEFVPTKKHTSAQGS